MYIYRSRFKRIFSLTTTRSRRNLFVACKIVCLILYTIWLNGIATNNPNKLVFAIYFWRTGPPVWQQYGSTSLSGILVCIDCSAGRRARHLAFGISAAVLESTLAFCAEFLGRPWCSAQKQWAIWTQKLDRLCIVFICWKNIPDGKPV